MGQIVPVKIRVFDTENYGVRAMLDGGIFNGCELNLDQVRELQSILFEVEENMQEVSNGEAT
ncbi:MAG: hypothetical protein I4O49_05420 [Janthinobacterium lividum]|nr:hypothetical protein [Janthinobacterium lividum]